MLVDDVAVERRLLRRVLENDGGFEVTAEAGDGREAVDMVAVVAPDLILLDLSMPDMDGLEALPLLLDASPGTKVLVLSGLSASQAAEPARRAGAHGYIEKGAHPDEIVAHMTALLDGPGAATGPSPPVGQPAFSGALHAASSELFVDPALLHRQVLDALHEGVVVQDRDGVVQAANLSAQQALGLRPDPSTGRLVWNGDWRATDASGVALAPEEHPAMVALRTGEPQLSITIGVERSNDERGWLLVNAVPLRRPDQTAPHGVVWSFVDVTDAVRLATALRESEELLRLAQEHSSIGMALVSLDGTWLTVNPALCRIVGRSKQELLGLRFQDITHPDDLGVGRESVLRLIAGEIDTHTVEKRYLHGDGRTVWVQIDGSLVRDADGAPRHLIAQVQDITERKRSQKLLDLLFTASPDLLCIAGTEGRLVRVNPSWSKVLGWSAEELTSRPFADFLHPDDVAATAAEYDGLLGDQGETVKFENRYRTATGTYRWLQWNTIALPEEGLMVCNARDMTSHKEREATLEHQRAELARSNADLEQFAYVASHDLSEPLRIISGFVTLLETELGPDADGVTHEYMRHIGEGAVRMHTLIRDLLAYSRVGRAAGGREPTDLGEVFAEVTAVLDLAISEAGAAVEIGPLPVVTAHRALMHQLAQNLVANALKFSAADRPPLVVVSASEAGAGRWTLRVEDNGIGIEPGSRERIFMMFERLHSRDDYEGTGIGLAICQRIVEGHGGTIAAEESTLGGTAIVVTLPELQETA